MLQEELGKLTSEELANIAEIWGIIPSAKTVTINSSFKKNMLQLFVKAVVDEYYLKGVLEKLTPVQVQIYSTIVTSKTILTLGEISRKIRMQPINVEKELFVLKHLMLVYLRKNRERLTNNLDKYYPYEEIQNIISVNVNKNGEKFRISIKKNIETEQQVLSKKYRSFFPLEATNKEIAVLAVDQKIILKCIKELNEKEIILFDEVFINGGLLEINTARVMMDELKLDPEKTLRKLHELNLAKDIYFVEDRFVRLLVLPLEIFEYLEKAPLFPKKEGVTELQEKNISNEFDFVLNLKKLLLFTSKKGLTLAQSSKVKQIDLKKSEESLIIVDVRLFPEKSQVHQLEIILPFLKIFDLIDIKGENIVLKSNFEEFLKKDPLALTKEVIEKTHQMAEKRLIGQEIFHPVDIPFFKKEIFDKCIEIIKENKSAYLKVIMAKMIRETVILVPTFRLANLRTTYLQQRNLFVSALFYMHFFGLLKIEYPKRLLSFSEIGDHLFHDIPFADKSKNKGLYINSDGSITALPDKMSLFDLHLLKSFSVLTEADQVLNFKLTKESVQEGILLGHSAVDFNNFLDANTKNKIPQNILFLIAEWTDKLPIVTIEESVVLLETANEKMKNDLLAQVKKQKINFRDISPTAMVIPKASISEVMNMAEKLEMIVKLIR